MASGQTLCVFTVQSNEPPTASYATRDDRNGQPCLDFDAAADESAVFSGVMPRNYAGGGITIALHTRASSATSGAARWLTAIERANTDNDTDSFATANSGAGTANGTSGIVTVVSIAHTNGAQMDSVAVGEEFRLKVTRDADGTSGTHDMTGDAELYKVEIRET
jgi:hypothetical protein